MSNSSKYHEVDEGLIVNLEDITAAHKTHNDPFFITVILKNGVILNSKVFCLGYTCKEEFEKLSNALNNYHAKLK